MTTGHRCCARETRACSASGGRRHPRAHPRPGGLPSGATASSHIGLHLAFTARPGWTHNLTLGYDRSYLGFTQTAPRLTTPADTFLYVGDDEVGKASVAYNTSLATRLSSGITSTLTAGIDHYTYDPIAYYTTSATTNTGSISASGFTVQRNPTSNTGIFGQLQLGISDALFLTAGIRGERNTNFGRDVGTAWAPRVGVAYTVPLGGVRLKVRASYGDAIRAPLPSQRSASYSPYAAQLANQTLGPERQRGMDGGVDVELGRGAALGVTYYDQTATDLIAFVLLDGSASPPTFQYQNIGRIRNKGWELEARAALGPLRASGTFSLASSRIERLAPAYLGDYRVGDDLLNAPRRFGGITLTYAPTSRTSIGGSVTYIGSWTSYDAIALYGYYHGGQAYRGSNRAYWIDYPAVTKLGLSVSQQITSRVDAFARVDNLANTRRFERDNITTPMGRSVLAGARVHY